MTNDALKVTAGLPLPVAFAITPSVHKYLEPDTAQIPENLGLPSWCATSRRRTIAFATPSTFWEKAIAARAFPGCSLAVNPPR